MKPHRIRMTHNLLLNYGLYRKMEIYVSVRMMSEFMFQAFIVEFLSEKEGMDPNQLC